MQHPIWFFERDLTVAYLAERAALEMAIHSWDDMALNGFLGEHPPIADRREITVRKHRALAGNRIALLASTRRGGRHGEKVASPTGLQAVSPGGSRPSA